MRLLCKPGGVAGRRHLSKAHGRAQIPGGRMSRGNVQTGSPGTYVEVPSQTGHHRVGTTLLKVGVTKSLRNVITLRNNTLLVTVKIQTNYG